LAPNGLRGLSPPLLTIPLPEAAQPADGGDGLADASAGDEGGAGAEELVGAPTEIITQVVEGDMAYVVAIERGNTKVGGQSETSDIAVRVTTIYRQENDRWHLVHRHADTRVGRQPAEAILST
jgi:ketosteroid isomerase-like protein